MAKKRIETETSRTAEWTCVSRAASALESDPWLKGEDRAARIIIDLLS